MLYYILIIHEFITTRCKCKIQSTSIYISQLYTELFVRLGYLQISYRQWINVLTFAISHNSFWYIHISKMFHKIFVSVEWFRRIKKNIFFFSSSFIPFLN